MASSSPFKKYEKALASLRHPVRLRIAVTGLLLLAAYVGVWMPLSERITESSRKLEEQRRRGKLIEEVSDLREQLALVESRLPEDTDTNEWIQRVLDAVRELPIELISLDPDEPRRVGPYEAVVLQIKCNGKFQDFDALLQWFDSHDRLFRVDSATIAPSNSKNDQLTMQLTVLGLKG
jgi:type II secretory pathway component PulM